MNSGAEIEAFILAELNSLGKEALTADEDLLDSGMVDSIGLVQLVSFIEEKYSITVNPEDLVPDNFASINAITSFISEKSPA